MTPVLQQFDLSGRAALITGSGAGIGLSLAQGLTGAGASVVLNGRREDRPGAAVFLASKASRFADGHVLCVDGGVTATL